MKLEPGNLESTNLESEEPVKQDRPPVLWGILFAIAFLGCIVYGFSVSKTVAERKADLSSGEQTISDLKETLSENGALPDEDGNLPAVDDSEEKSEAEIHNEIANTFLKTLFTWKNHEEYATVRSWLTASCGMGADSSLLTAFMPEISEADFGDSNMKVEKVTTYEVQQDGNAVQYFAICEVSNRINNHSGKGRIGVFYTVADGRVGSISAYSLER